MDRGGRNCSPAARGWRGKINVAAGRGPWTCSTAAKSVPRCFSRSSFQLRRERERPALFPFPKSADHLFYQGVFDMCFDSVLSAIFIPCEIRPDAFFHQPLWNSRIVWKFVIEQLQLTILEKDSFWSDRWLTLFLLRKTIIAVISLRIIAEEILKTFTLVNRYFLPRRNHDWETSFFPLFKRNYRFARWKFSPFKQNARQIVVK